MTGINTKIIAIVAGVVVLGAGAYFITSRSGSLGSMEQASVSGSQQTSLRTLMAAGNSVKCTFTTTTDGQTSNGTVYIADGKMRGDFSTIGTPAGDVESHMVLKDDTNYVWSSSMPQGIKMNLNAAQQSNSNGEQPAVSYDQNLNYDCSPWSGDQSYFDLPTTVQFMDMSEMMQGAMPVPDEVRNGTSVKGGVNVDMQVQQCAACEQLSGSQKAQCKAALQCE